MICPWNIFSLGIWKSAHPIAEKAETSQSVIRESDLTITLPAETHALMQAEIQKSRRRLAEIRPGSEAALGSRFDFDTPPRQVADPLPEINTARSWIHWVAIVYALGAAGMLCWLAIGQWAVSRLVRRCSPSDAELNHMWADLQQEMSTVLPSSRRGGIRLLISNDVAFPIAVGVFRSAVLLPRWLVDSFTVEQIRPVLAHELAHVLRHDALLRWCASLFQVVFFYQPFYWWLQRELRLCQEYLADAHAAAWAKSRPEYAAQLVAIMRAAPAGSWRPSPAIGILEGRSELYRRIQMLVKSTRPLTLTIDRGWNTMVGAALILFSTALGLMTLRADDVPAAADSTAQSQNNDDQQSPSEKKNAQPEASAPVPVKNASGDPITIRIVDTKGVPVAGAKVKLSGFSVASGTMTPTFNETQFAPRITESDMDGRANVVFPAGVLESKRPFLQKLMAKKFEHLSIHIDHPNHPTWFSYHAVDSKDPIVLADSATVEVRAFRGPQREPVHGLFPEIGRQALDWSETDGVLTIRRVDNTSKQAEGALRVVHIPDSGPALFSELIDLKPTPDQRIVVNAELKPGVRLEGQLGAEVPRPVKNGRVFATLASRVDAPIQGYWEAETEIAGDGTFVFESLPANEEAQLVAVCDGW
ncbi:MAG TPA: M56 family metallopeptidase, partial [Schlesneria sp.]